MERWMYIVIGIFILAVVVLGILVNVYYLDSDYGNEGEVSSDSCEVLGCSGEFVGSVNSDKYYPCDCRYAKIILPENVVCFEDSLDAESQGYARSEC